MWYESRKPRPETRTQNQGVYLPRWIKGIHPCIISVKGYLLWIMLQKKTIQESFLEDYWYTIMKVLLIFPCGLQIFHWLGSRFSRDN